MSTVNQKSFKSRVIKKLPIIRIATAKAIPRTNAIYSGVSSAQRAIEKSGSSIISRYSPIKQPDQLNTNILPNIHHPPMNYQSWSTEFSQINARITAKKSMTKDPYIPMKHLLQHANETILTADECCPPLIASNSVKIEKPIIHHDEGPIISGLVRYLRPNEPFPSSLSPTPPAEIIDESSLQSYPISNNRLLDRPRFQIDASVIRRPPRRLLLNFTHETIRPLSVYG